MALIWFQIDGFGKQILANNSRFLLKKVGFFTYFCL